MKKSLYLLRIAFMLALSALCVTADASTNSPIVTPRSGKEIVSLPSPTAATLCSHMDYPIDYSTGRVSINIPIYTY